MVGSTAGRTVRTGRLAEPSLAPIAREATPGARAAVRRIALEIDACPRAGAAQQARLTGSLAARLEALLPGAARSPAATAVSRVRSEVHALAAADRLIVGQRNAGAELTLRTLLTSSAARPAVGVIGPQVDAGEPPEAWAQPRIAGVRGRSVDPPHIAPRHVRHGERVRVPVERHLGEIELGCGIGVVGPWRAAAHRHQRKPRAHDPRPPHDSIVVGVRRIVQAPSYSPLTGSASNTSNIASSPVLCGALRSALATSQWRPAATSSGADHSPCAGPGRGA